MTVNLSVLVSFNGSNGNSPVDTLFMDAGGDLFGTTEEGGAHGDGTVFEIAKTVSGWSTTPNVLVSFKGPQPLFPEDSVIEDINGDLFGTTSGGTSLSSDGEVFEVVNTSSGYNSTPMVLDTFNVINGAVPLGGLIADANGNLFGTTSGGGFVPGTVFEIANTANGYSSTVTTLAGFDGTNGNATGLAGSLIMDANGDLFGTASGNGPGGVGTVFEIQKTGPNSYSNNPTTLAAFNGANGAEPNAALVMDASGDLFGTTAFGGANQDGSVFEIKNTADGYAPVTTLVSFNNTTSGETPNSTLILDADGDLFGTTSAGGTFESGSGDGTLFEIANSVSGYASTPTTLVTFTPANGDGYTPEAGLVADANGDLFGTTSNGSTNKGTVFEVTGSGFVPSGGITQQGPRTLVWTGSANGSLADSQNWNDTTDSDNPAIVAPDTTDAVVFDTAASVTSATTVTAVTFSNGASVQLTSDATLAAAGAVTVGDSAVAQVTIEDGSELAGEDFTITGSAAASDSSVNAIGAGSQLNFDGSLNVGAAGFGSLALAQGGSASASGVIEAGDAMGDGEITVNGTGSALNDTGGLTVGGLGIGQLDIDQSGFVTAASLDAGQAAGGSGEINVVGTGASLGVTAALTLGDLGTGGLNISNGAIVTVGSLIIGNEGSAAGDLVIGAGSTLVVTTTAISVGVAGSGVLDIQGGTLSLANGTSLSPGTFGRIVQVGGLIDPAEVFDASGGSFGGGGTMEASGTVTDTSVATVSGGSETVLAPLITSGDTVNLSGVWSIKSAGTVILNDNTVDISQTFSFGDGSADVLFIGHQVTLNGSQDPVPIAADLINNFDATIQSFFSGDKIEVDTTNAVSFDLSGSVISLVDNIGGATEGTLTFHSAAQASAWKNASGALVDNVQCFAAGTRIGTVDGPVAVEALSVGDRVLTNDGDIEPIVWIGQRRVDCARHPDPGTVWPVRIAAGAFAENVPLRDLYLSPDHAVFVNGALIPVKYLINGTTIAQVRRSSVRYYHVELGEHEVILAEDLPVESYLDIGDRDNFADQAVVRLVPDLARRLAPDVARLWETRGAAPLVMAGRALEHARRLVNGRRSTRHPYPPAEMLAAGTSRRTS